MVTAGANFGAWLRMQALQVARYSPWALPSGMLTMRTFPSAWTRMGATSSWGREALARLGPAHSASHIPLKPLVRPCLPLSAGGRSCLPAPSASEAPDLQVYKALRCGVQPVAVKVVHGADRRQLLAFTKVSFSCVWHLNAPASPLPFAASGLIVVAGDRDPQAAQLRQKHPAVLWGLPDWQHAHAGEWLHRPPLLSSHALAVP